MINACINFDTRLTNKGIKICFVFCECFWLLMQLFLGTQQAKLDTGRSGMKK